MRTCPRAIADLCTKWYYTLYQRALWGAAPSPLSAARASRSREASRRRASAICSLRFRSATFFVSDASSTSTVFARGGSSSAVGWQGHRGSVCDLASKLLPTRPRLCRCRTKYAFGSARQNLPANVCEKGAGLLPRGGRGALGVRRFRERLAHLESGSSMVEN